MSDQVRSQVLAVGQHGGATRKELLAALVTGIVESHFENLPGGTADSSGWRQERARYYRNPRNVTASAGRFFSEARALRGRNLSVGQLAQAVQRSAYPDRYAQHLAEARRILDHLGSNAPQNYFDGGPAGGGPTVEQPDTKAALVAALASGRPNVLLHAQSLLATGAYTRRTVLPDTRDRYHGGALDTPPEIGSGRVHVAPGADRPGVHTQRIVTDFAGRVAGVLGRDLTLTTGTRHNQMTTSGNVSDHWTGHAGDFAMSGVALTRAGQAALIAAGKSPRWAHAQRGGLFNVMYHGHRVQIIFNSNIGGNHYNHLHIGIR